MDVIKGSIAKKEIEEGISRTGKKYIRYVFEVNEKKYSTFDSNIGDNFGIGDYVEMQGETPAGSKYWNMKSMAKIDNPQEHIPTPNAPVGDSSDEIVDLLRQILAELRNQNGN